MEDDDDNDNEADGDDVHIGDDNEDISGKPRCTGTWVPLVLHWYHGRAVELYRESIEASQVVVVVMVKILLVLMIS